MIKKAYRDLLLYRKISKRYLNISIRHESILYYSLRVLKSGYNLDNVDVLFLCKLLEDQANDIAHSEYELSLLSFGAVLSYFLGNRLVHIREELDSITDLSRRYYKSLKQSDFSTFTDAVFNHEATFYNLCYSS